MRSNGEGRRYRDAGRGGGEPAERDLPCETGERACDPRLHLRKDAHELHPHPAGRQGDGTDDAVRLNQGTHYVPSEVRGPDESDGISEENLPQVQDRAAQRRGASDLLRSAAQAETGMTTLVSSRVDNTLNNQL